MDSRNRIPYSLKFAFTAMVAVVVPFYLEHHGWRNFLWFSDIALIGLFFGLWLEHRLLISMLAVGTLLYESAWVVDFLLLLVIGQAPLQIAGYMGDTDMPLFLRALSLFHLVLPLVLLVSLRRLGYDRRAWKLTTLATLALLPLTRVLTQPEDNINWVYGFGEPQTLLPGPLYVGLLMVAMPLLVFAPTHWLLCRLDGSTFFRRSQQRHRGSP